MEGSQGVSCAQGQTEPSGSAAVGLTLLLSGGVAEAMEVMQRTLATVQEAATQALAGLGQLQAAAMMAATVPPPRQPEQVVGDTGKPTAAPEGGVRQEWRAVRPPPTAAVVLDAASAFVPSMVPDGEWLAPMPDLAPASAEHLVVQPTVPPTASHASVTMARQRQLGMQAPTLFATFAPTAPNLPVVSATLPASIVGTRQGQAELPWPTSEWPVAGPEDDTQEARSLPAAPPAVATGMDMMSRAYAPMAMRTAAGGPVGGDVFLDGTRVGTWVTDHLAREAGRPQSGGTSFDPRLTPAWPGTLQGN